MQINQNQLLSSSSKVRVVYSMNVNVAIIISDFQQKYVNENTLRRSVCISKILLIKKLK